MGERFIPCEMVGDPVPVDAPRRGEMVECPICHRWALPKHGAYRFHTLPRMITA
jgi:hypothetical protein